MKSRLLNYIARNDYNIYDYVSFPITIVFLEETVLDEEEKIEEALVAGGYDPTHIRCDLTDAAIAALVGKVFERAKELGIEVEDYGYGRFMQRADGSPTDQRVAEATFHFPSLNQAMQFKTFLT